jgi:hypothetical protein
MFDYLNSILYKKSDIDFNTVNEDKEFQPFLVQRWCSMYSPAISNVINETTNRYWKVYGNNSEWYATLNSIIPACKYKRINYLKKTKKDIKNKSGSNIQKIATNLEISTREVNLYIEQFNLKIPNEEKHTT